jgi:hypothetical protein
MTMFDESGSELVITVRALHMYVPESSVVGRLISNWEVFLHMKARDFSLSGS